MVGDAGLVPVVPLNMGQMVANFAIAFQEIAVTHQHDFCRKSEMIYNQ